MKKQPILNILILAFYVFVIFVSIPMRDNFFPAERSLQQTVFLVIGATTFLCFLYVAPLVIKDAALKSPNSPMSRVVTSSIAALVHAGFLFTWRYPSAANEIPIWVGLVMVAAGALLYLVNEWNDFGQRR